MVPNGEYDHYNDKNIQGYIPYVSYLRSFEYRVFTTHLGRWTHKLDTHEIFLHTVNPNKVADILLVYGEKYS